LIDALEIFSGLIMFAEAKAEDKIRFLFDLFDFNEI
jgi:microtubule-associated protein-like 5